jgi:NAD(P)-dependent dehydrogenase (short-subunit alcohol dehydrogenase family)
MCADMPFAGKVAVVTGAGNGLGRAHALHLAGLGAAVVVNDIGASVSGDGRASGPAQAVVDEIIARGGAAVASVASVTDPEGAESIVQAAVREFGWLDIVVCNAGILRDRVVEDLDEENWHRVLDVHLGGTYRVVRAAWKHLAAKNYGRIVVTTSAAGLFGNAGHANYGAAKAGVFGLMRMLTVEAAERDIRINAVAPLALTRMSESKGDRTRASDVMGGLFQKLAPEHVSPLVAWLCHDECPARGQAFSVGGGRIAEVFVAESRGWVGTDLTWQSIRDNWPAVGDRDGYTVPQSMRDELALYSGALG